MTRLRARVNRDQVDPRVEVARLVEADRARARARLDGPRPCPGLPHWSTYRPWLRW